MKADWGPGTILAAVSNNRVGDTLLWRGGCSSRQLGPLGGMDSAWIVGGRHALTTVGSGFFLHSLTRRVVVCHARHAQNSNVPPNSFRERRRRAGEEEHPIGFDD